MIKLLAIFLFCLIMLPVSEPGRSKMIIAASTGETISVMVSNPLPEINKPSRETPNTSNPSKEISQPDQEGSNMSKPSRICVPEGLMAYYPFNGNANDESENGNHVVFNNASLTEDRFGNAAGAYRFNGINNYMRISNSPTLNPKFISIVAIVKVSGFYKGPCHGNVILNKGDDDWDLSSKYRMRFADDAYKNFEQCNTAYVDEEHQTFWADHGANKSLELPYKGPFIEKDKWYCLVYTFDGRTARFYIDGKQRDSWNTSEEYHDNSEDLFFGKLNNNLFPYWFNGVMDEIRIYNRAISQEEINAICSCNTPELITANEIRLTDPRIEQVQGSANFKLSPNPARTYARVQYESLNEALVEIRLIDMTGKLIYRQRESVRQGTNLITIQGLQQFPNGTYTVQLISGNNRSSERLVIVH